MRSTTAVPDEGGPGTDSPSDGAGPPARVIRGDDVPVLWKLARLAFDDVRAQPVLLYPEGVVLLNESGAAILRLCDSRRSVDDIVAALSRQYATDVATDVTHFLSGLVARELVRIGADNTARG